MQLDPTRARFPFRSGGYESFYLLARHPRDPLAVWIRSTVLQAPGEASQGQTWFTLFEPSGPTAIRVPGAASTDGAWIRTGAASFDDGVAGGSADDAAWDLRFVPQQSPLPYLPSERMYRGGLPKTKPISLAPVARFDGSMRVGDRSFDVANWHGMLGHNWGSEHASKWVWLHGLIDERTWIDVVAARVRLGPVTTPWIANGAICLDGVVRRLGGMTRTRRVEIDAGEHAASLVLPGDGIVVRAQVEAAPDTFVRWDYAHPRSGSSDVRNCSIADLRLEIRVGTSQPVTRTARHAAAYEFGVDAED